MNCQLNTILKQTGFVHDIDAPYNNTAVCGKSLSNFISSNQYKLLAIYCLNSITD